MLLFKTSNSNHFIHCWFSFKSIYRSCNDDNKNSIYISIASIYTYDEPILPRF